MPRKGGVAGVWNCLWREGRKHVKHSNSWWPWIRALLLLLVILICYGYTARHGPNPKRLPQLTEDSKPDFLPKRSTVKEDETSDTKPSTHKKWSAGEIVKFMNAHPSRAYFARLFSDGGFRNGMEVGVADGRFSEHMLTVGKPALWRLCEPFPNDALISRYPAAGGDLTEEQEKYRKDRADQKKELASKTWHERGIDKGIRLQLLKHFSTDKEVIDAVPKGTLDFVYLDGAHDYVNVKKELEPYWEMIAPGGVLAGHDYQNHGEKPLKCKGCDQIPKSRIYTDFGIAHGKKQGGKAADMDKVVKAVQEWVVESHPDLTLHHTLENFTRESLAADGLDFDLVITNTYNPSWYFIKESTSAEVEDTEDSDDKDKNNEDADDDANSEDKDKENEDADEDSDDKDKGSEEDGD